MNTLEVDYCMHAASEARNTPTRDIRDRQGIPIPGLLADNYEPLLPRKLVPPQERPVHLPSTCRSTSRQAPPRGPASQPPGAHLK